jgi:hypothetical protein
LCTLSGLHLVETYFEKDSTASKVSGGKWRDSAVIAMKPRISGAELSAFNKRLKSIAAPFEGFCFGLGANGEGEKIGTAFQEYRGTVLADQSKDGFLGQLRELRSNLKGKGKGRIYE